LSFLNWKLLADKALAADVAIAQATAAAAAANAAKKKRAETAASKTTKAKVYANAVKL
jgi:hypothetical protein